MKPIFRLLRLFEEGEVFTAFDTETTGLGCRTDRITELGAVKFDKNGIIDTFSTLLNPQVPIPAVASQISGITDAMVCDCPTFAQVQGDFMDFIKGTRIVAHNANFDINFVNNELGRLNLPELRSPNVPAIDTIKVTKIVFPYLGKYNLQFLAKEFKIDVHNAHRASDDARVCMEVLLHNFEVLKSRQN